MPVLLDLLSASARLALPYVTAMVEEGLSANSIQSLLPSLGVPVRRSDLLDMVRQLKGNTEKRPYLTSLQDSTVPNPARLGTPITSTLRDFSYLVEVRGTNTETGESMLQYVTVSTSQNLPKGAIKSTALDIAEAGAALGTKSGGFGLFSAHEARLVSGTYAGNL